MVKVLHYEDLEKIEGQPVYLLALPLFFEDKVKAKWPLDKILAPIRGKASTFIGRDSNPKAVRTKEEWVAVMLETRKKYLVETIVHENKIIDLLEELITW